GLAPYTYQWTFGDGAASTSQSVVHRYTAPGTYDAQVTVRDSLGSSVSSSVSVLVRPSEPQVSMLASLQSGVAPLTISFSATIMGGVRPDSYAWDFGDGGTSTEVSTIHRYDKAGTYIVTVTTTDALGRTATDTETISVQAPLAGVFSFESPVLWILVGGIGVTLVSVLLVAARKRGRRKRASRAARWRVNESVRR
ncbi:MAG: PKD domain-containing protein, partial [Candidatus Thermoplasmatota archaeon]